MTPVTRIFDLLNVVEKSFPDGKPVFTYKERWNREELNASQYIAYSRSFAAALINLGIKRNDKIVVILPNRLAWNIIDMGIMLAGAIIIPVYSTLSAANFCYIFQDSGATGLIVNDQESWERIKCCTTQSDALTTFISVEPVEGLVCLRDLLQISSSNDESKLEDINRSIGKHETATIIYTSGTTGRPKGVMLSHDNIINNFMALSLILAQNPVSYALSFLPLCHIYERSLNYVYQYSGVSVHYLDNIDNLRDTIRTVKPEVFCAVPRILEKIYATIVRRGRELSGIRKRLFFWAIDIGLQYDFEKEREKVYAAKLYLARKMVFNKWKSVFGGRIQFIVSGGASLNPKLARIYWAAGIKVMEGYGLTETSPVIAVGNFLKGGVKFGTVGPVLPGVMVKLAEDGEILCKGPGLMKGYYNRPERTAEVIDHDGWFHTGDIGEIVDGKYLRITDRKKEMFKTSGGKYIAPQVIENLFKESAFIENIMVLGEGRKHPAALIVPNKDYLRSWCEVKEIEFTKIEEMIRHPRIVNRYVEEVAMINQKLGRTEQIKKFRLLPVSWTPESGELSPTLKLRRNFISEKYLTEIEKMYT